MQNLLDFHIYSHILKPDKVVHVGILKDKILGYLVILENEAFEPLRYL